MNGFIWLSEENKHATKTDTKMYQYVAGLGFPPNLLQMILHLNQNVYLR